MCGICGILGVDREVAIDRVAAMCRDLAHRGPDDELVVAGAGWALGQRRLSVIDLSSNARQPFVSEDGSRFLTSNGEIYNYQELRPGLVKAGHRFVSDSDCEIILHLLEEEGESGILKLNGMYAFAYLDEKRRKVLLCRDRLGIKPLYYRKVGDTVAFASEIKALLGDSVTLARDSLQEFFQYRFVSGSNTLFQDVREVLPGHLVSIDLDTLAIEVQEYWAPPKRVSVGKPIDEKALGRAIEQSVARQLVSDVPVGCQLSGGLDSSLITQMAVRQMNQPMHTFSVGFEGLKEDESSWAALVAMELGTRHHMIHYQESDFLSDLAICTWLNDEPLNHPNSMAMFKMCQEAKRYVTVLMTGEGADELFGGYTWHKRLWRLRRLGRLAQWPLMHGLVNALPGSRFAPILPLLGVSPQKMAAQAGQWVSDKCIREILEQGRSIGGMTSVSSSLGARYSLQLEVNAEDPVAASLDLDLRTYLVSVLQRQDRMSMASGVESRVPFLDNELVDFALRIPVEQLFEGNRGKAVLRHVAMGRINKKIINRPKVGFRIPLADWMRQGRDISRLLDWLYDERSAERMIWKLDPVRQLVAEHRSGKADHSNILWSFLSFEVWARIWLDGIPHERLKEEIGQKARTDHRPQTLDHRPKAMWDGQSPAATGSNGCINDTGVAAAERASCIEEKAPIEGASPQSNVYGLKSNVPPPKPLRICHIVTSLRMGGMERMVCDLMGGLKERGIESVLCCTDEMGELYDGAQAVAKLCGHRTPGVFVIDWKLALQIRQFVRDNQIDVIHAHNHVAHLYGAMVSLFTGVPLIATWHGQGFLDTGKVRFVKRILAGKTSTVVLVSDDAQRVALVNRSLSAGDAVTVIPNGIDIRKFRPLEKGAATTPDALRARLGIPANAIVIGSVGRLSPEKNYSLMVRAFGRLVARAITVSSFSPETPHLNPLPQGERKEGNQEGTPLHPLPSGERAGVRVSSSPFLLLVGDGPDRSVIEAEITRLGIQDRCFIAGMQSEVLPWLHLMDIFSLSSDTEGLSISLLEAGACRLPSVVTDAGGNREIVRNGVSGLVVPLNDDVALSEGFERLMRDAAMRQAMGVAARRIVEERYSLDSMVAGYVKVYEDVRH